MASMEVTEVQRTLDFAAAAKAEYVRSLPQYRAMAAVIAVLKESDGRALSHGQIAARAGVSVATVKRAIAALRATSCVQVTGRPGQASVYHVMDDGPFVEAVAAKSRPANTARTVLAAVGRTIGGLFRRRNGSVTEVTAGRELGHDSRTQLTSQVNLGHDLGHGASLNERLNEEEKESVTQSLRRCRDISGLPSVPLEVWTCPEGALGRVLLDHWLAWKERYRAAGVTVSEFVGAVLATRGAERTDPQRYFERCLRNGVRQGWIVRGRRFCDKFNARHGAVRH
ncbi:MAG: HTH domain-containing protein [Planctomycetes bacterium]|nr:HTH domain-containing protein [Planctomycetota bacterium]